MHNTLTPEKEKIIQQKWLTAFENHPRILKFVKRLQAKIRWLKQQNISPGLYLKTQRLAAESHRVFHQLYGFPLKKTSHENIRALRRFLAPLTSAETNIYHVLTGHLTGAHLTHHGDAIRHAGEMKSVRLLESEGNVGYVTRRTMGCNDNTVHFLAELPNGGVIPGSLHDCTDRVVVALAPLQQDPLVCPRTFVSGHLGGFTRGDSISTQIAETRMIVIHRRDETIKSPLNNFKEYTFLYPDGSQYRWSRRFEEEVFAGAETLQGIAYLFLTILRHLGGQKNTFIRGLYAIAENDLVKLQEELKLFFPIIFDAATYPELKIFDSLKINVPYVTISPTTTRTTAEPSAKLSNFVHSFWNALLPTDGNECKSYLILLENLLIGKLLPGKRYRDKLWENVQLEGEDLLNDVRDMIECIVTHTGYAITATECQAIADKVFGRLADYVDDILLKKILSARFPTSHPDSSIAYHLRPSINFITEMFGLITAENVHLLNMLDIAGVNFTIGARAHYEEAVKNENILALAFLCQKKIPYKGFRAPSPLIYACMAQKKKSISFLIDKYDINEVFKYPCSYQEYTSGTILDFYIACAPANDARKDFIAFLMAKGADFNRVCPENKEKYHNNISPISSKISQHKKNVAIFLMGHDIEGRRYTVLGMPRHHMVNNGEKLCRPFYGFPGGAVDSKETPEEAAFRELGEETGITGDKIANATIISMGTFSVNHTIETTFFLVDIGIAMKDINPTPLDDLIKVKKLPLDALNNDSFLFDGKTWQVLPSNALIIQAFQATGPLLSESTKAAIAQQLQIEDRGLFFLLEILGLPTALDLNEKKKINKLLKESTYSFAHLSRILSSPVRLDDAKIEKIRQLLEKKADFFGEQISFCLFVGKLALEGNLSLLSYSTNREMQQTALSLLPEGFFFQTSHSFSWFLDNRYITLQAENGICYWRKFCDFFKSDEIPQKNIEPFTTLILSHPKTSLREDRFFQMLLEKTEQTLSYPTTLLKEDPFLQILLKKRGQEMEALYSPACRKVLLAFRNNLNLIKKRDYFADIPHWLQKEISFFEAHLNINAFLSSKQRPLAKAINFSEHLTQILFEDDTTSTYTLDALRDFFEGALTIETVTQLVNEKSIFLYPLSEALIVLQKKCLTNVFRENLFSLDDLAAIPFASLPNPDYWGRLIRETTFSTLKLSVSVLDENLHAWRTFLIKHFKDGVHLYKLVLIQAETFHPVIQNDILSLIQTAPFLHILDCHHIAPPFLESLFQCINREDRRNIELNLYGAYDNTFYDALLVLMEKISFFTRAVNYPGPPEAFISKANTIFDTNRRKFFRENALTFTANMSLRYSDHTLILPLLYTSGFYDREIFFIGKLPHLCPDTLIIECENENVVSPDYFSFLAHNQSIELLILKNLIPILINKKIDELLNTVANLKMPSLKFIKIEFQKNRLVFTSKMVEYLSLFLKKYPIQIIDFSGYSGDINFNKEKFDFRELCDALKACKTLLGVILGEKFFKGDQALEKIFNDTLSESDSLILCDHNSATFQPLQNKIEENRSHWAGKQITSGLKRNGIFSDAGDASGPIDKKPKSSDDHNNHTTFGV